MRSYLFTSVRKDGRTLDEGDDNVIVFARKATLEQLRLAFGQAGFSWDESYEIPGNDVQFHVHQACYLTEAEEAKAAELAAKVAEPAA